MVLLSLSIGFCYLDFDLPLLGCVTIVICLRMLDQPIEGVRTLMYEMSLFKFLFPVTCYICYVICSCFEALIWVRFTETFEVNFGR